MRDRPPLRAGKEALGSFVLAIFVCSLAAAAQVPLNRPATIRGAVHDPSGNPVDGATVLFRGGGVSASTTTGERGNFELSVSGVSAGTITVEAAGFTTEQRRWMSSSSAPLSIVLPLAPLAQRITVTANRLPTEISQTAGTVAVISAPRLAETAALSLDGILGQVPGFELFRRTDSRIANPTSQGVSLRGVGSSGASRALVLENGVPINDPFGGWVYWDLIPRAAISRIEVAEGGASDLYGSTAMGGVINVLTRPETRSEVSLDTSYGNERSPDGSLWASAERGKWGAQLSGEAFNTDGYILVAPNVRGPIDTPAGSNHSDLALTIDRQLSNAVRAFLMGEVFGEARKNGTPLQTNRTHLRRLVAGVDWQSARVGAVELRGYGQAQLLDQNFSAVTASRNAETLTDVQRSPAQEAGFSLEWAREVGTRQTWVAGVDGLAVRGASNELLYSHGKINSATGTGGRQDIDGVYAEDVVRLTPRWILTANARYDHWRNFDALSASTPIATPGPTAVTNFAPRTQAAFSPRLSLLRQLTPAVSVYASAFRSFRAPTLNELYRPFRVGNVVTLANSALAAERLNGAEVGASFSPSGARWLVHTAFFWNQINQPIENVTVASTPSLITDQRQNLGSTRSAGLEIETQGRLGPVALSGGYQFADATVLRFPANPVLVGLFVPQVPRQSLTFQASYSKPALGTVALQGHYIGVQYDDDLNQFPLAAAFILNAFVSHSFRNHLELYSAVENLTGQRYQVARVPYTELGPPVLVRVGVRFNWGPR